MNNLEFEEELSTMAILAWAEGTWMRYGPESRKKLGGRWSSRFRRGGKWEDLQELLFARPVTWASSGHSEGQEKVDVRFRLHAKNMLLKQATTTYWRKWPSTSMKS